jgi:hypothetical protein
MSDQLISPSETLERLLTASGDSRRKRSLEALNEACKLLHERNSSDFSYKTIVTLGKDRGLPIPGIQSIQNTTGAHYRELINAWKLISVHKPSVAKPDNWIDSIEDPVLRMSVTMLAKELRALKSKEARKAAHSGAPIFLGSVPDRDAGKSVPSRPLLNDVEFEALKSAIDPQVLRLVGLSIGPRGEVINETGKRIHKPGFRDAIEKVLSVGN